MAGVFGHPLIYQGFPDNFELAFHSIQAFSVLILMSVLTIPVVRMLTVTTALAPSTAHVKKASRVMAMSVKTWMSVLKVRVT